jgi:ABC-2 type transport system permease protein
MTIAAINPVAPARAKQLPPGRYSLFDLMRSEWTKLRSVRSTMWTLAITIVVGVGVSALATAETRSHWAAMSLPTRLSFDPTQTSLIPLFFCQLVMGVLGVLVMSAEFGTGTIRATVAAAPRRWQTLLSKIAVFGAVALVFSEAASFLSFFVGQAMLTAPVRHATLSTPGTLRAVVGTGLYLCIISLFALGLGTILRHTAGAISAFVGFVLVLPLIVQALPNSIQNDVVRFLPARIGTTMMSTASNPGAHAFSPWVGFAVLCGYALVTLVAGGALFASRDV